MVAYASVKRSKRKKRAMKLGSGHMLRKSLSLKKRKTMKRSNKPK